MFYIYIFLIKILSTIFHFLKKLWSIRWPPNFNSTFSHSIKRLWSITWPLGSNSTLSHSIKGLWSITWPLGFNSTLSHFIKRLWLIKWPLGSNSILFHSVTNLSKKFMVSFELFQSPKLIKYVLRVMWPTCAIKMKVMKNGNLGLSTIIPLFWKNIVDNNNVRNCIDNHTKN